MNTLIIIVIYNKKIEDLSIFKEPFSEAIDIFIYDNSANSQKIPSFANATLYYEQDVNNSGVSRAYNQGALKAQELGKDTVLLLDHDTFFLQTYLSMYDKQYRIYGDKYLYAPIVSDCNKTKIYSPSMLNHFVGKAILFDNFLYSVLYDLTGKSVINSGLMIPLSLFIKIGGFNEKLKLDFSDIYFIEKYKEFNKNIVLTDLYIKHSISGDEGIDFAREFSRFKYYCYGSRELGDSLGILVWWSPFRRLLRLTLKYKSLVFISIYINYFLKRKII